MAPEPPETPEGPGWCGQGAVRDQHGPDLSGVASQRPNRLRGLSVEGKYLSRDFGKRQCRTRAFYSPAVSDPEGQGPGKREARSTPTGLNVPLIRRVKVGPARKADRQDGETEAPACRNDEAVSLAAIWRERRWRFRITLTQCADVPTVSAGVAKIVGRGTLIPLPSCLRRDAP